MGSPLALTPRPEEQIQKLFGRIPSDQRMNSVRQLLSGPSNVGAQNLQIINPQNPYSIGDWSPSIGRAESMRVPGIQPGMRFTRMPTSDDIARQADAARRAERESYLKAAGDALSIAQETADRRGGLESIFGISIPDIVSTYGTPGGSGWSGRTFFDQIGDALSDFFGGLL